MSCEPEECSFLFFLFYISTSGGMAQLADGEGGAQTWRIRGGAQQLSARLADMAVRLGAVLELGKPVRKILQRASKYDPIQGLEAAETNPRIQSQRGSQKRLMELQFEGGMQLSGTRDAASGLVKDHRVRSVPPLVQTGARTVHVHGMRCEVCVHLPRGLLEGQTQSCPGRWVW